jgi:hypothetical protein
LAAACCAALLTSSRLERLMIEPSKTSKKAKASPVSPMRMRCALLPAWYGIEVDEAMARIENMQASGLTAVVPDAKGAKP